MFSVIRLLATLVVLNLISTPLFSAPRFTEFMASNNKTLLDEDDDASDWTDSGLILHSEEHNGDGTTTLTYRSANPVEILPDDGFFRVVADQR